VIYTETLQMFVIVGGSLILAALSFHKVGGFAGLVRAYPSIDICGAPGEPWQMLRHARDPHMPWAGFVFGQTPASIWYWCTDQVMAKMHVVWAGVIPTALTPF
jgi:sodium/myo-inositol cotransporter 3